MMRRRARSSRKQSSRSGREFWDGWRRLGSRAKTKGEPGTGGSESEKMGLGFLSLRLKTLVGKGVFSLLPRLIPPIVTD